MVRAVRVLRGLFWLLAGLAFVAWAVATVTFVLMRAIPGGPLSSDRKLPEQVRAAIEARYHLDDPVLVQYRNYLVEALQGRFGLSINEPGYTVGELIARQIPVSATLGVLALGIALTVAFPLGMAAALRPGRWPDRLNAFVAAAGVSVPSFILGTLLLYFVSFRLGWVPSSGWRGVSNAILPAFALSLLPMAYMTRLLRSELREVLHSDFIMTARAKGLRPRLVVVRHALRHTLSPILTFLGPQTAGVMTGSFVIESIFNIPGLGKSFVTSITNRDYPMIMGVTLFYTVLLVSMNMLFDAAARWLDPRTRHGH